MRVRVVPIYASLRLAGWEWEWEHPEKIYYENTQDYNWKLRTYLLLSSCWFWLSRFLILNRREREQLQLISILYSLIPQANGILEMIDNRNENKQDYDFKIFGQLVILNFTSYESGSGSGSIRKKSITRTRRITIGNYERTCYCPRAGSGYRVF